MAAAETLAPMWPITARDAAALIEPRESFFTCGRRGASNFTFGFLNCIDSVAVGGFQHI